MLNRTDKLQVHRIINQFFERWPDPVSLAKADPDDVARFIKSLGLYNRRAKTLIEMSRAWIAEIPENIDDLPGIGKYAADSYSMFCEGYLVLDTQDKELSKYVRWAQEVGYDSDHDVDGGIRGRVPACP
jgi:adenine-specific DNA glycosylase